MFVVATDPAGRDLGVVRDCALDLAIGDGRDDFELTVPVDRAPHGLCAGGRVYVDGTEYGGVVDDVGADTSERYHRALYRGRTWSGVLESKVLAPNPGTSHLAVSGEANAALKSLVDRAGLAELFDVDATDSGFVVDARIRYATGCAAMRSMLAAAKRADGASSIGAKLSMRWTGRKVVLSAEPAIDRSRREAEAARTGMRLVKAGRPVNHLVCLGGGELEERTVVHLYADAAGAVGPVQSLFGLDERARLYDYGSAGSDEELVERGTELLRALQDADVCDVSDPPEGDCGIGDVIGGRDSRLGVYVRAAVASKTVSVSKRGATVTCRAGNPSVRVTSTVQ